MAEFHAEDNNLIDDNDDDEYDDEDLDEVYIQIYVLTVSCQNKLIIFELYNIFRLMASV